MPPKAVPPPQLNIPVSSNTVKVSILDSTTHLSGIPCHYFYEPNIKGFEVFDAPAYCFLIEHGGSNTRLVFDLAVRKDLENHAPVVRKLIQPWNIRVQKNVSEVLVDGGVDLSSIEAIIWSHRHFDHTGDPSLFPSSTDLVVGPGFRNFVGEGYPHKDDSPCTASAWEGRKLIELDFNKDPRALKIGRYPGIDWFGDGSFYLLQTPGHTVDHICGLVRTRLGSHPAAVDGKDEFILLGGDIVHHSGEHRPSQYEPIPEQIGPDPRKPAQSSKTTTTATTVTAAAAAAAAAADDNGSNTVPGAFFAERNRLWPNGSDEQWNKPFLVPAKGQPDDYDQAVWSIEGLEEFDCQDNIFVLFAHDDKLANMLDYFPNSDAADWRNKGWKRYNKWHFLADFKEA